MELMVVVTIMAILSAILLPALSKGKSRSQAISCLNNLRQLQLGWHMYQDDNTGSLPDNNYITRVRFGSFGVIPGSSWCPGNAQEDVTTENIEKGQLFRHAASVKIYHCPADNSKTLGITGTSPRLRTRSYSMSSSVGFSSVSPNAFRKLNEVQNPSPSRLFVFTDTHPDGIIDGHFTLFPTNELHKKWIDMPADRHGQAGNLSFADGHIERWRWNAPKLFFEWQQPITNLHDLSDMTRMQAAMRQP